MNLETRRQHQREKESAYAAYRQALAAGVLVRPDACSKCHEVGRVEGHHHSYASPLEVQWLCRTCHAGMHIRDKSRSYRSRPRCSVCGYVIYWHLLDGGRTTAFADGVAHLKCAKKMGWKAAEKVA